MVKTLNFEDSKLAKSDLDTTPGGTNRTILDKVIDITGGAFQKFGDYFRGPSPVSAKLNSQRILNRADKPPI
jgi:hypothetical protein